MRKTAVVADSVATLPGEVADRYEITVVPLQIAFGLETYRDGVDMSAAAFYSRLAKEKALPTTSAPLIGDLASAYGQAASKGEAVVAIHVSSKLSGTMAAARQAADLVDAPVHLLDSRTGAAAEGLVALAAARSALAGAAPEVVLAEARRVMDGVGLLVMLDTLAYLRRGGRVGAAQAWLGAALRFKPILTLSDGVVQAVDRPRTRERGIMRMVELMAEDVQGRPVHAVVTHAAALAEAEALRQQIDAQFDCRELLLTEFTPVMGTHTGPGLLGMAWWAEEGNASSV